jgi:hypothetical protein
MLIGQQWGTDGVVCGGGWRNNTDKQDDAQ